MNALLSHIISFAIGLFTGILGAFIANRLSKKADKKDIIKDRKRLFKSIFSQMPDLIQEMKQDLFSSDMNNCREFFISPSMKVPFSTSSPAFFYYEDMHDNLMSKIRILEKAGFIFDITPKNTPMFQFEEEFIELLKTIK